MFNIFIILLFCSLVLVLVRGFYVFMQDKGDIKSRRLVNTLALRILLAILLIIVIIIGVYQGDLVNQSPWDNV